MTHLIASLAAILRDIARGFFFLPDDSPGFSIADAMFARKLLRETIMRSDKGVLSAALAELCQKDPELCVWAQKKIAEGEAQFARRLWVTYRTMDPL